MLKYPKAVPSKTATGRAILSFVVSAICVGESPVQLQSGVRFQPHFKLHFEGSSEQQLFLSYSLRTQLKPLRQELVCGLIAERPVNAGRLRPSSETAEVGTGSHLSANVTNRALDRGWLYAVRRVGSPSTSKEQDRRTEAIAREHSRKVGAAAVLVARLSRLHCPGRVQARQH